jgi:cytochrome P450 family 135
MGDTLPPGPSHHWLVQAAMMIRGPRFLEACHRRYGDRFTLRLGRFGTYVYLADPADIREVFHGDDRVLHAGEANAPFLGRVLGPTSVLVTDDQLHLRQRRRLSGPFHGDAVARLVPRMAGVAAADVESWPVGRSMAVLPHTRSITLEVILQTVVGITDEQRLNDMRAVLFELVDIGMVMMAAFVFPSLRNVWPWKRFQSVKARADALLYDEIARARRAPDLDSRPDVLAMLARATDEDGSTMTDQELRDQLVTLLLAGHETTATGLAWAIERLVRHPAILGRATTAAREGDDAYLDAVVTESLRVRPVVPDVSRLLTAEFRLGEYVLPAGVFVDPAIYLVQRSPASYEDPLTFRPERFVGRRPDPNVWLPFGGGTRRCLGAAFAAAEMRVVLAEILRRVDLAPTTAAPERARIRHVTLAPHAGAKVVVRRKLQVPARDPDTAASSTAP